MNFNACRGKQSGYCRKLHIQTCRYVAQFGCSLTSQSSPCQCWFLAIARHYFHRPWSTIGGISRLTAFGQLRVWTNEFCLLITSVGTNCSIRSAASSNSKRVPARVPTSQARCPTGRAESSDMVRRQERESNSPFNLANATLCCCPTLLPMEWRSRIKDVGETAEIQTTKQLDLFAVGSTNPWGPLNVLIYSLIPSFGSFYKQYIGCMRCRRILWLSSRDHGPLPTKTLHCMKPIILTVHIPQTK